MAGETSGPGPSEQEIRMVALERKRTRRDIPTPTPLHQGRRRHQSQKGKDSQLDSKIDSLGGEDQTHTGFELFRETRTFSSMSWFPNMTMPPKFKAPEFEKYNGRGDPMIHLQMYCRKMAPYADNEPLLIQTFQDTLTGNAAEWYSQLKKISHWKELADTFLAQYGFNSQIAPDRFDLQRMEKKSNEDLQGICPKFFVDLIPVGERIEDALKTKKIVDMTALMALAEQAAKKAPTKKKEGDVQMIGRSNGRPRQVLPTFTMQPIQPRPTSNAPAPSSSSSLRPRSTQMPARPVGNQANDNRLVRKRAKAVHATAHAPMTELYPIPDREEPNLACCPEALQRTTKEEISTKIRDLSKDCLTSPLILCPNHPEGGVNMVEIEERERRTYRVETSLLYIGEAETHHPSVARKFKKKVTDLMENGLVGREEIPSKGSHQPDDPSDFDWYAELNLDDIVEDEMDLDNLQDEGADWGYFMEDDTDEWRDVDFTKFFQFPCLIVPPGFETPEFEIFYENGDPEVHLQKYGEKMALHLENELLMISVFPESLSKQAAAWFYQLRNLTGWDDLARVFLEAIPLQSPFDSRILGEKKKRKPSRCHQPKTQIASPLPKKEKSQSRCHHQATTTPPPLLKKNMLAPMVGRVEHPHHHRGGGFHHHTTDPPLPTGRRSQDVDLCAIATACLKITRKTSNDPHVSKIDNKTNCSLDNIDNSDEEIELPNDILEALERQDEGSKPNIEELEIVNLANEGEEPREVKIGTRCATEQKEALIALLREFHEIFAWSYQDMPGLDTDIVVHKIPLEARMQARQTSTATNEARSHFEDQGRSGKAIEGRIPKHSNLFGLGSQYSPSAEKGRKTTNVVFSFMDGFSGTPEPLISEPWSPLFHDMIHHEIEVYVDDMIAKSRTAQDHLTDLRKAVPATEEVSAQTKPEQVQAIRSMPAPKDRERDPKLLGKNQLYSSLHCTAYGDLRASVQVAEKRCEDKDVPSSYTSQSKKHPWAACWDNKTRLGRKEQAIYYLSKKFTEPETRYLLVEKTCCALAWASKKLRQYMLYYTTWLAIKGQAIADYLADYPSEQLELMDSEFPDEDVMTVDEDNHGRWKLYFDGAANAVGSGIGAVLVSPKGQQTPIAVKLGFDCTNNMTEYEACIVGLQAALEFGAYELEVFGDSLLIVSQTNGEWQGSGSQAHPVPTIHQPASPKVQLVEGDDVRPLRIETRDIPAYCVCVEECMNVEAEIDNKPWYYDIKRFIQDREYPPRATENEKKCRGSQSIDPRDARGINGSPCQRTLPGPEDHESWLLLVDNGEGLHQTCPDVPQMPDVSEQQECTSPISSHYGLAVAILSLGNGCDSVQLPQRRLTGMKFILVAIDYFTKWVEACSFKNVTQVAVTRFVKNNIICRYGMPEMLITDNASNLNNRMMDQLCQQFKIQHHNSAPYRPKMNGAVEAANKNVKKILSKMTETYKGLARAPALCLVCLPNVSEDIRWSHPLLSGIWDGSSTTSRSGDPFFENPVTNSAGRSRMGPSPLYQRRIERAYNKKARPRTFQPGDLVLKKRNMALSDPRGKFAPSYEGPYVVKKAFSGGAIILADMDGEEFRSPINSDSVIKYHV
uniref:Integrase catalytic domain-containing protein n=1 Tax=Fagus sylvatica TaxID=28930 RepID=A0A2N9FYF1_FAGSY